VSGGGGDSTDSDEESDDAASGGERKDETGNTDTTFETGAGDDGNGGSGNEAGLEVGDLLRIWWKDERVWFRCKIEGMGDAGRMVRVTYLVDDRWGAYVHALDDVEWERWEMGDAVDPREADYDMDVWVADEELDHEAATAASTGCRRRSGDGGSSGQGGSGSGGTDSTTHVVGDEEGGEDEEGRGSGSGRGEQAGGGKGVGKGTGGFDWVVLAAPKGAGSKKRKILLGVLIGLWAAAAGEEGEELPAVQKRAIYKKMTGTLSVKQVGAELVLLEKAGTVVVEGDGVRCSEIRSAPTKGSRRAGGGAAAGGVDTGRGGRTVVRRKSGSEDESDTGSTGESETSKEVEATGRATRRAGKRRRDAISYVESDQGSEEEDDGGWG
jgi:hypothetical protein